MADVQATGENIAKSLAWPSQLMSRDLNDPEAQVGSLPLSTPVPASEENVGDVLDAALAVMRDHPEVIPYVSARAPQAGLMLAAVKANLELERIGGERIEIPDTDDIDIAAEALRSAVVELAARDWEP